MTTNASETLRQARLVEINAATADRLTLEQRYGQVWNPEELRRDFVVRGYLAPYVVVERKQDGLIGSLEFQHAPRFYFDWKEDR